MNSVMKLSWIATFLGLGLVAHGQEDRSTVFSYKTTTAPTMDGQIDGAEWDAAGPWINVTAANNLPETDLIPSDVYGGDSDISYRFKSMWVEGTPTFFIVYEIFDDIAMDSDPVNLWERDQMETFIDGNSLEGESDRTSFHWWEASETYGKLGVSRYNTFEGNTATMTDNVDLWDEGYGGYNSISGVADIGTNADYRIELGVSIVQMLDDADAAPFFNTPTEAAGAIVQDSTVIKYTNSISDDDNFFEGGTERSSVITYFRELDGVVGEWDQSNYFANLTFVGAWEGVIEVPGDCNGDGALTAADLQCATGGNVSTVLAGLKLTPGDLDGVDGVAFADFLVLSANFGQQVASYAAGDIDGDGSVQFADFLTLSANFGAGSTAAAVPEPSGLAMAAWIALVSLGLRRRLGGLAR